MATRLFQIVRQLSTSCTAPGKVLLVRPITCNFKGDSGRRYESHAISPEDEPDGMPEREFVDMSVSDFEGLADGNSDITDKISTILSEYEHLKYDSIGKVPSVITKEEMSQMLEEGTSYAQRQKLIHYFYKREMDRRQSLRRKLRDKEEIRIKREARAQEAFHDNKSRSGLLSDEGHLMYGLWHNSLFSRIPDQKLKMGQSESRLKTAAMFGRKVIFDFSYDDFMNRQLSRNTGDQIQTAYGLNRFDYKEPVDLWFCNFDENSVTGKYVQDHALPNLHNGSMITVKSDCMTKHFDKSRLVYLSPNAKETLGPVVRSDDIYVIGAFNDKGKVQPLSLRKASIMGIRAKSLPIDQHLLWQGPSKALCLNHVLGILLEVLSNGNDWHAALTKHIPPRKIKPPEVAIEEERRRRERLAFYKNRKPKQFSLRMDFD